MSDPGDDLLLESGFWLDEWYVEPMRNCVSNGANTTQLEPKVMDVLVCLVRRAGKTVTKENFLDEVWSGTVVTDDVLSRCISRLRKTLEDDSREPRFIETIRKTGYRLITPVVLPDAPLNAPATKMNGVVSRGEAALGQELDADTTAARPATADTDPDQDHEASTVSSHANFAPSEMDEPAIEEAEPGASRGTESDDRAQEEFDEQAFSEIDEKLLRRILLWRQRQRREQRFPRSLYVGASVGAIIVLLGVAAIYWRSTAADPDAPPTTTPFTSYPGLEVEPVLSPTQNQIAFAWDNDAGRDYDIYIKQAGSEPPLRITDEPTDERSPAWSPDGLQVAFVRNAAGNNGVYVVPAIGGGERRVAGFGGRRLHGLVWSPDGSSLAVSAQISEFGQFGIHVVDLSGGAPIRVSTPPATYFGDIRPAFSPDGTRLAFVRAVRGGFQDVYVMSIDGGEPERRTFDNADVTGLAWTLDGRFLVFTSHREGTSGLWKLPAGGGEPEWVSTAGEGTSYEDLSMSQLGPRLVYAQRSSNTNIWRLQRSEPRLPFRANLLISSTRWESNPQISPDGSRIAFASNRSGAYEIWTSSADGADAVQLTSIDALRTDTPRWSPDGSRIAFVSYPEGQGDLYVLDAEGGSLIRLTTSETDDVAPAWSNDGRYLYFSSTRGGAWQIWRIPASGGEAEQITQTSARAAFESADGDSLYFVKPDMPGIWSAPLSVDSTGALLMRPIGAPAGFAFADDDSLAAGSDAPMRDSTGQRLGAAADSILRLETPVADSALQKASAGDSPLATTGAGSVSTGQGAVRADSLMTTERLVVSSLLPIDWGNWAMTDAGIYFVRRDPAGPTLVFYDFATTRIRDVAPLRNVPEHPALAVAPDGTWFLYTQVDNEQSDIVLLENFR